jgi:hypothetical protein
VDSAKQNFSVKGISDKVKVSFTVTNSKSVNDFRTVGKFIHRILTGDFITFFDDTFLLSVMQWL